VRWALVLLVLAGSGCKQTQTSVCADGSRCPTDMVCAPEGGCAFSNQIEACFELSAGERCNVAGAPGVCTQGVCASGCGDAFVNTEAGEDCEGTDFQGLTCQGLGFYEGDLGCTNCAVDESQCTGFCGDNQANGPEACDGAAGLPAFSCSVFEWGRGLLECSDRCDTFVAGCSVLGVVPVPDSTVIGQVVAVVGSTVNDVWVAASSGQVSHFDGATWRTDATLEAGLIDLQLGIDGSLFAHSNERVYRRDGSNQWTNVLNSEEKVLSTMVAVSREFVVVYETTGVTHVFRNGGWSTLPAVDGRSVRDLARLSETVFASGYIDGTWGILRLVGNEWVMEAELDSAYWLVGFGDTLYATTFNSVHRYQVGGEVENLGFEEPQGGILPSVDLVNGILWATSYDGVLSRYDGEGWEYYAHGVEGLEVIHALGPWQVYLGGPLLNDLYRHDGSRTRRFQGAEAVDIAVLKSGAAVTMGFSTIDLFDGDDVTNVCRSGGAPCPPGANRFVAARSETEWWVMTFAGEVYRFDNPGFTLVRTLGFTAVGIAVNQTTLVAATDSELHELDDSGWTVTPIAHEARSVWLGDDGTVAVGGDDGQYSLRIDGVWQTGSIVGAGNLHDVAGIDAENIWFRDDEDTLYRMNGTVWAATSVGSFETRPYAVSADELLLTRFTDGFARVVGDSLETVRVFDVAQSVRSVAGIESRIFVGHGLDLVVIDRHLPWSGCQQNEICENRIDDNCDGYIDEGCPPP
jgi:hypothetical protein